MVNLHSKEMQVLLEEEERNTESEGERRGREKRAKWPPHLWPPETYLPR